MRDFDPDPDPLIEAFYALTTEDVSEALTLIDCKGIGWLQQRTGCFGETTRLLRVGDRSYPLKATGYLAAQLSGGIAWTTGNPVPMDRVVRAICRVGFDVT